MVSLRLWVIGRGSNHPKTGRVARHGDHHVEIAESIGRRELRGKEAQCAILDRRGTDLKRVGEVDNKMSRERPESQAISRRVLWPLLQFVFWR
jgi:hypothetical protein